MVQNTQANATLTNHDEVVRQIYKTFDYAKFVDLKQNRQINALNYAKLQRSMEEEQLLIPICVNEKFEIIDGQHRAKVCQELGLPIYYYQENGYGVNQMKRANLVSANWSKEDFLNMYVSEDIESYIQFEQISSHYGITVSDLIKVIARFEGKTAPHVNLDFVEGNLVISNELFEKITDFLLKLKVFSFFPSYRKQRFVSAFLELYSHPSYNHEQMEERLQKERSQHLLKDFANREELLETLINKIYSFGVKKNRTLFYDINRKLIYMG